MPAEHNAKSLTRYSPLLHARGHVRVEPWSRPVSIDPEDWEWGVSCSCRWESAHERLLLVLNQFAHHVATESLQHPSPTT